MSDKRLVEKLIEARKKAGLSQGEVAAWYVKRTRIPSKINPQWLIEIETESRKPYGEEVSLLIECYGESWEG